MGRSIASGGDPKGSGRERREAGIQWIQPPKAVSDPEFRQTTSGTHGSAGCADCLPRGKPPTRPLAHTPVLCGYADSPKGVQGGERKATLLASIDDNFAVSNSPLAGIDAPTPAREKGLQPYGALTLFFRWRKKSVQKKASGTATPGKSPLLPILAAGLAMSRAAELASYACYRARSCSPFSAVKMGRPFSLRCLTPLCSPAVGDWYTQRDVGWRLCCSLDDRAAQ